MKLTPKQSEVVLNLFSEEFCKNTFMSFDDLETVVSDNRVGPKEILNFVSRILEVLDVVPKDTLVFSQTLTEDPWKDARVASFRKDGLNYYAVLVDGRKIHIKGDVLIKDQINPYGSYK